MTPDVGPHQQHWNGRATAPKRRRCGERDDVGGAGRGGGGGTWGGREERRRTRIFVKEEVELTRRACEDS